VKVVVKRDESLYNVKIQFNIVNMKDNKYLRIGIIALILIVGISILAVGAFTTDKEGHHSFSKDNWDSVKGDHYKSAHHECGDYKGKFGHAKNLSKEEYHDILIEKLGLPDDASDEEILGAVKENKMQWQEQYRDKLLEKLGLPDDATDEEVKEALQEWKNNKHIWHDSKNI
jgi:hypothetical protein